MGVAATSPNSPPPPPPFHVISHVKLGESSLVPRPSSSSILLMINRGIAKTEVGEEGLGTRLRGECTAWMWMRSDLFTVHEFQVGYSL